MTDLRKFYPPEPDPPVPPDPRIRLMNRLQGPWGTYVEWLPGKDGLWPVFANHGNGNEPNPFVRWWLTRKLRKLS